MSAPMPAARGVGHGPKGDLVEHNAAFAFRFGAFAGWTLTGGAIIKGAAILVFGVTPAGFLALAAAFTIEWVAGELLEVGAFKLGEKLTFGGMDGILNGSPNVSVNRQPAARGGPDGDLLLCCPGRKILGGSKWVNMNRKPAARYNDWLDHSGKISTGSEDTLVGGPTVEVPEKWEYQDWFKYANIARELGTAGVKVALRSNPTFGLIHVARNADKLPKTAYHQALDSIWGAVK